MNKKHRGLGLWFVYAVVLVALAWFLAPLVSDLAAMRPRLTGSTAVNQVTVPGAVVPVAAPVLLPTPTLAATATAVAPGGLVVTFSDSVALPSAVASPTSSSGVGLLLIEAGGRAWQVTAVQLVDCINAQENGLRTGPTCPPNAKQYVGMLGQGR